MTRYMIFIRSNEHARTINTPTNGRVLYSKVEAFGKDDLFRKVEALKAEGKHISEVCTDLGTRLYF